MTKPNFEIGQKAFILGRSGKVLIIKRHKDNTKSLMWDFPGGRINFNETLRGGLLREVKEETGLKLRTISSPLNITTFIREVDRNTQVIRIIYLCFAVGTVKLSDEHSEYMWINPKEYKKYKFVDENYSVAFKNYLKLKPKALEFLGQGMLKASIRFLKAHK